MGSAASIHPSAVVEAGAQLGASVRIGPFCYVGPDVVLGDGVELMSHVTVIGATTLGEGTKVYPQAVLGGSPQNRGHKGGRTTLTIGRNCTIREFVTMHTGTDTSRGATEVGDNCFFLAYSHVAHDCQVGDNVTMTNGATLGGHCELGNNVSIGGLSAVHQFVRIGDNAFLAGGSMLIGDLIPFGMAMGNRAELRGFNVVGMKRSGMARSEIMTMRQAYRMIFDPARPMSENLDTARETFAASAPVMKIIDFLTARGRRPFCVPPLDRGGSDEADDEV